MSWFMLETSASQSHFLASGSLNPYYPQCFILFSLKSCMVLCDFCFSVSHSAHCR